MTFSISTFTSLLYPKKPSILPAGGRLPLSNSQSSQPKPADTAEFNHTAPSALDDDDDLDDLDFDGLDDEDWDDFDDEEPSIKDKEKAGNLDGSPKTPAEFEKLLRPFTNGDHTFDEMHKLDNKSDQLNRILNRTHINGAVLSSEDERLRYAVLSRIKRQNPDMPIWILDCETIQGKKQYSSSHTAKNKTEPSALLQAIQTTFPLMKSEPDKPVTLVLEKLSSDPISSLLKSDDYKDVQQQFPGLRLIISSDGKHTSRYGRDEENTWRTGQFEHVQIASLQPHDWVQAMQHDPFAQSVLDYWHLQVSPENLRKFFDVLQQEKPEEPLTYKTLVAELDSLGSFVNLKQAPVHALNNDDIVRYTQKVIAPRRVAKPKSGGPSNKGPVPYDLINPGEISIRMQDVVGNEKAKKALMQSLREVKFPKFFDKVNQGDPDAGKNAVLLWGDPGNGKTMLAKALAGEGGATFISTSGARFATGLVGGGANAFRRVWDAAESAPTELVIIAIDEMEAMGTRSGRSAEGGGSSASENTKTVDEYLALTDGIKHSSKRILIVGMTNHPKDLDPAVLSRFNEKIECKPLKYKERKQLLNSLIEQKNLNPDDTFSLNTLARQTRGLGGRDLRNLMKFVKNQLTNNMRDEDIAKLEIHPELRESFELRPSHFDFLRGLREAKKVRRELKEEESEKKNNLSGGGPITITS